MRHTQGFTLLEIVVALAILGIAVAVVMQIFSGGLKNIHRIDMAHRAMHHAENVMNEILSDQEMREPVGLSEDLDEEFAYTAEVDYWEEPEQDLSIEVAEPRVYLLSVRVDVHFKNDLHGKLYRTVCLKTVSNEIGSPVQTSADAIRQLFGARQ
ncbi:type II secretion system GspH family protein [Acidobacteria bacterium AH-259-L09]|nr:type II secretion system GspH family protein [Acidobacteria bacterium AH-259-L09]